MKLTKTLDRFLVQLEADGRSPHTIGQYRRHLRFLERWLAGEGCSRELASIDHEVLARFLAAPVARTRPDGAWKKATAMNCLRSSIRTFFEYAHQAGYVSTNPVGVIKRAICGNPPPRSLSPADLLARPWPLGSRHAPHPAAPGPPSAVRSPGGPITQEMGPGAERPLDPCREFRAPFPVETTSSLIHLMTSNVVI